MFVGVLRYVKIIEVVTKTVQGKEGETGKGVEPMARGKPPMTPPGHSLHHFVLQLKAFLEECLGHRSYPL